MIKTPLRYPGGKSRCANMLIEQFPDFKEYREPFIGGGSVFIRLKEKYPEREYWINDIYKPLYMFYIGARDNLEVMTSSLRIKRKAWDKEGIDLYTIAKNALSTLDNMSLGTNFFIVNRSSFSGTSESGGYSESAFRERFTLSSIERIRDLSKLLKDNKVKITNLDYSEVINENGEDVFMYLDPPYYTATKSALYGKNGGLHKCFDHEKFAEDMKKCKHKWLITYDDCDYIRNLFSFAEIIPFKASYGMKNVNKDNISQSGNEIIIKNY